MKNPYEQLIIYNFDGVPALDGVLETDERFLGTWVEEDTSFVFFPARRRPWSSRSKSKIPVSLWWKPMP